jgi:prepilin-type N-terminal cleavage/methylation domain-containing protein
MNARCFLHPSRRIARGFTLLEMMITLAIFALLAAAVFGLIVGVLQSTSTLQDNQNRRDQVTALHSFLKKQLGTLPAQSSVVSYQRGAGEGLVQNGIIFGTKNQATAIDAKVQVNGYYTLRVTNLATAIVQGQVQDPRQVLLQSVTTDDPSVVWTTLVEDVKSLDWKFLDFNSTVWVELWNSTAKPNLVEFSVQTAGDLQPTTMDFWLPRIDTVNISGAADGAQGVQGAPGTPGGQGARPPRQSPILQSGQ